MPAVSEKQRRFMGAELGRLRKGTKRGMKTGMKETQLRHFAKKPSVMERLGGMQR